MGINLDISRNSSTINYILIGCKENKITAISSFTFSDDSYSNIDPDTVDNSQWIPDMMFRAPVVKCFDFTFSEDKIGDSTVGSLPSTCKYYV